MKLILNTLLAVAMLSAAATAETQTVYVTAKWTAPVGAPAWVGGQTIDVRVDAHTANDSNIFEGSATVDYEQCSISTVIDVTGLPPNYVYGLYIEIPEQTISSGGQSATIAKGVKWIFPRAPTFQATVHLGTLTLN